MCGTYNFVVLPTLSVGVFPLAVFAYDGAMAIGKYLGRARKKI
jgi:hypothetical protein